jgi:chemotaxis methyl-accepting protein methylase
VVGKAWRERYFRKERTLWRADAKLRGGIRWCCADLLTFSPPPCDIALFRNVAIYLRDDSILPVWERLVSALTPGGFLVSGKAEKPPSGLPLQCVFKSIYQKSVVAP